MSTFTLNTQINTSRDGANFAASNPPQPHYMIHEAQGIVRALEREGGGRSDTLRAGWAAIEGRERTEQGADRQLAVARDLLAYARERRVEASARREQEAEARAAILAESQAAGRALLNAIPGRTAWANQNCRNFWTLGADLKALAEKIEATRPTPPVMQMMASATAPIGTASELLAALDALDADLARLSASVAKARTAVKVAV